MKVVVRPGSGVTVEDRMRIRVAGHDGFAVRLNHLAKVESVRARGRKPPYLFGGGLFWVDLPEGPSELTIRYSNEVETGPDDTNSGSFLENAGHLRSQYFWHPFFGFNTPGDGLISASERRRIRINGPEAVVRFSGDVSDVKIDPDGALLLRP
jgi:hypothetical protein